jgi:hypothetical protein
MSTPQVNHVVVSEVQITCLHSCGINVVRKVAVADLERCRFIVDEVGSDDVELRDY